MPEHRPPQTKKNTFKDPVLWRQSFSNFLYLNYLFWYTVCVILDIILIPTQALLCPAWSNCEMEHS